MLSTKKLDVLFELEDLKREMDALDERKEVYELLYANKYGKKPIKE